MEQLSKEKMRAITNQLLGIGSFLLEIEDLPVYIHEMKQLDLASADKYIALAKILDTARDEIAEIEPRFKDTEFVSELLSKTQTSEAA
jgi:hypothetical protein